MSNAPVIHVEDAELAERLTESATQGTPLRVEVGGKTFVLRVEREKLPAQTVPSPDYDPDKVAEVLDKYVGAWAPLDVDRMIADLYKAREEGSRPADCP